MALTKEYVDAVSQGNLLRVKIMLKDSLLVDTSFEQFNEMLNYAEPRINGIWISDAEDDEYLSDAPEELNAILAGLVNNFSKRRVTHLKGMINKVYPPQPKVTQNNREVAIVIKKTREVRDEYSGIIRDRKKLNEICGRITQREGQINTIDIKELRNAAMSIVSHCDNITRK